MFPKDDSGGEKVREAPEQKQAGRSGWKPRVLDHCRWQQRVQKWSGPGRMLEPGLAGQAMGHWGRREMGKQRRFKLPTSR